MRKHDLFMLLNENLPGDIVSSRPKNSRAIDIAPILIRSNRG